MSDDQERGQATSASGTEPLLVRVEEAARLLSLSRATVYRMMDSGELPSVRRGTARRVLLTALREWIARQTASSSPS